MFGRKKGFSAARIDTLIGQGTEINGDLVFSGGLHVDGKIVGNVIAEEGSTAILILSEFGCIEGDVKVPNMVLNGEVIGDVYCTTRVELASKSRVKGSVYYNLIEMAIGAEVNGGLNFGSRVSAARIGWRRCQSVSSTGWPEWREIFQAR